MSEVAAQSTARTQLNTWLMTIFGLSALLLASIGIYGLISYAIQQGAREIGIRVALGAEPSAVGRMIMLHSLVIVTAGAATGLVLALGVTRLMTSLLFGVTPTDPIVFVGIPGVLVGVGWFAAWLPSRRASRIDPAEVLRCQ